MKVALTQILPWIKGRGKKISSNKCGTDVIENDTSDPGSEARRELEEGSNDLDGALTVGKHHDGIFSNNIRSHSKSADGSINNLDSCLYQTDGLIENMSQLNIGTKDDSEESLKTGVVCAAHNNFEQRQLEQEYEKSDNDDDDDDDDDDDEDENSDTDESSDDEGDNDVQEVCHGIDEMLEELNLSSSTTTKDVYLSRGPTRPTVSAKDRHRVPYEQKPRHTRECVPSHGQCSPHLDQEESLFSPQSGFYSPGSDLQYSPGTPSPLPIGGEEFVVIETDGPQPRLRDLNFEASVKDILRWVTSEATEHDIEEVAKFLEHGDIDQTAVEQDSYVQLSSPDSTPDLGFASLDSGTDSDGSLGAVRDAELMRAFSPSESGYSSPDSTKALSPPPSTAISLPPIRPTFERQYKSAKLMKQNFHLKPSGRKTIEERLIDESGTIIHHHLLKAAERDRPNVKYIYERALHSAEFFVAELYCRDPDGHTPLYYAARLHKYDFILGFIADLCCVAEKYCKGVDGPSEPYTIRTHERYEQNRGDNIIHCLARWNTKYGDGRYLNNMKVILKIHQFRELINIKNNDGYLPLDLVSKGDKMDYLLVQHGAVRSLRPPRMTVPSVLHD